MPSRAHVFVSGTVQGVFFRQATCEKARSIGVGGWVRNLDDGRVEAVFEGDEAGLREMVRWCRKGPAGSRVDDAEVILGESPEGFSGFSVRG